MLVLAALAGLGAMSTSAMALEITMFPSRDFVEVAGLDAGDVVNVDVFRNGTLVGKAHNIAAFEEVPGTGFLVLVNHPGGPDTCWEVSTPDIVAGDLFRATVTAGPNNGVVDTATVADVAVTQPPVDENGNIVVRGFAQSAPGVPVPIADIEQRLIHAPGGDLFDNGTRRLLAPDGPDATLVFDPPGSVTWKATYKSLSNADKAEAFAAEPRILHFADPDPNDPAVARDLTIFEFGVPEGPFDPVLCPPLDRGPSLDLTPASDTGTSNSDNLTRNTTPTFSGQRGTLTAGPVVNLYDTTGGTQNLIGTTTLAGDGSFTVAPTAPLSEGVHTLRAGQVTTGPGDTLGPPLAITIDTTAPAGPTFAGTTPAGPANDNAPLIRGGAEASSTVRVFSGATCTGAPLATGTAAAFLAPGLVVAVPDNSTTTFSGTVEDAAGNTSACAAAPSPYVEVTPTSPSPGTTGQQAAAVTSSSASVNRKNWRVALKVTCNGPAGTTCKGRVSLVIKVLNKKTGKRQDVSLGSTTYTLTSGAKRTLQITLNARAQRLLANRTSLKVRTKLVATAGSGVAKSSKTALTLLAPKG